MDVRKLARERSWYFIYTYILYVYTYFMFCGPKWKGTPNRIWWWGLVEAFCSNRGDWEEKEYLGRAKFRECLYWGVRRRRYTPAHKAKQFCHSFFPLSLFKRNEYGNTSGELGRGKRKKKGKERRKTEKAQKNECLMRDWSLFSLLVRKYKLPWNKT